MGGQAGVDPRIASQVLSDMHRKGVIKKAHNIVAMLDQQALSLWSCECYALCNKATEENLNALASIAVLTTTPQTRPEEESLSSNGLLLDPRRRTDALDGTILQNPRRTAEPPDDVPSYAAFLLASDF